MNFKRLFFYFLLNIIVSAATVLIVLNIWDRTHRSETIFPESAGLLPTALASAIPPTGTPTPMPTLALRPYEVAPGETLGEIALQFKISVDQLLAINHLANPDQLATGMILFVPASNPLAAVPPEGASTASEPEVEPAASQTIPPTPENSTIRIVSIVGVDDLATEHIQIRSVSSEALPLEGWRIATNDGQVYIFPNITLFEYGAVNLFSRAGINSVVALYWGLSTPVFQSGDRAIIYDAGGNVQAVYSVP